MAIQNFVAGGFYGKLGAMVGQRWKNKRTLRTWVKPKNPRTEAQQANRGRFGGCVQLAQIAMQMNWKAPCWQSESLTEWNLRMRSATMLNKSELEPFNKIPLFPYAYVAKYAIHELKVKSKDPSGKVTFSAVGELPTEDRNISVLLGYINASTGAYDMELFLTTLTINEDDEKVFTIEIDDVSKVNNDSIYLICSNDDEEHDNESIYSNQIGAAGKITKVFDTNIIEYTRTANKHFFTFAEEYFPSETSVTNVKLYGVVAGNYETLTLPSVTLENFGGHFGFSMEQSVSDNFHIIAFASLSNIQIESISADSETVLSKAENTLNSFSSDDLTRTMKATFIESQSYYETTRVFINRNFDLADFVAKDIETAAVIAGVMKTYVPAKVNIAQPSYTIRIEIEKDPTSGSMFPIFNSQSKFTKGTISTVKNEVTYEHDLTGLKIEDTKKETTWDNTVKSVVNNEGWYTITFNEKNLDLTGETVDSYLTISNLFKDYRQYEPLDLIKGSDGLYTDEFEIDDVEEIESGFITTDTTITITAQFTKNEVVYKPKTTEATPCAVAETTLYLNLHKATYIQCDEDGWVIAPIAKNMPGESAFEEEDFMGKFYYNIVRNSSLAGAAAGFSTVRKQKQVSYEAKLATVIDDRREETYDLTAGVSTLTDYGSWRNKYTFVTFPNVQYIIDSQATTKTGKPVRFRASHFLGETRRELTLWTRTQITDSETGFLATEN